MSDGQGEKPASKEGAGRPGPSPAREAAARALARVWQKDAFASAALDGELQRARLDPRDAALATELVYGVLRTEGALLAKLASVASPPGKFRAPAGLVRAHLLIGAFTICFLDRVPAFAAVSEAVEAARRVADPRVGGFVNAVLRRLADHVEKKGRPALADAVAASCPAWLAEALGRAVGPANVRAYLTEGGSTPPLGLCVAPDEDRGAVVERLRAAAPKAEIAAGAVSPLAVVVRGAGDLRRLPGIGKAFIAQEEGAQLVALALGAQAGERVLDACAGHGNKTWVLAQQVGARGEVAAADLYAQKLKQIDVPAGRALVKTFAVDWSKGRGEVPEGFDRALVDAPCSGTGTLRRRPEILGKRTAADLPRLAALQAAIVRSAAACVHTGGRLVYAVCSVLREEAEDVVEAVTRDAIGGVRLAPAPFDAPAIRALFGEVTALRLLPHAHGTDGYFAASFVVERE